jgi:hypothetical protein
MVGALEKARIQRNRQHANAGPRAAVRPEEEVREAARGLLLSSFFSLCPDPDPIFLCGSVGLFGFATSRFLVFPDVARATVGSCTRATSAARRGAGSVSSV